MGISGYQPHHQLSHHAQGMRSRTRDVAAPPLAGGAAESVQELVCHDQGLMNCHMMAMCAHIPMLRYHVKKSRTNIFIGFIGFYRYQPKVAVLKDSKVHVIESNEPARNDA